VALVIGARQASAARRTATAPAGDAARAGRRPAADDPYPEFPRDASLAGDETSAAYAAGRRDTEEYLPGPDATQRVQPDADLYDYDDAAAGRPSSGQTAGPAPAEQAPDPADADYDHAANLIGGARADGNRAADAGPDDPRLDDPRLDDPRFDDSRLDDPRRADGRLHEAGLDARGADARSGDARGADARSGDAGPDGAAHVGDAGFGGARGDAGFGDGRADDVRGGGGRLDDARADDQGSPAAAEFDEPDPDDPDDEPLPQAVRPADAVRVARLDAEVLVVDGRPRYHLADCTHLVGRATEGLPVAEAVELGFSPCGLCRPVDRLVAAAARR
jgi:clumping factor A